MPLKCAAKVKYEGGRRYLNFVLFGQWTASFRWSRTCPSIDFRRVRGVSDCRVSLYASDGACYAVTAQIICAVVRAEGLAPALVTELLSVARSVAAGKAPKEAILGWMEDNLPHPWNLLATEDSVSLFRAVVPEHLKETVL